MCREFLTTMRKDVKKNYLEEEIMKSTIAAVKHFIQSEDGPTAVEYAVTAALVIIAAIAGISALGTGLNTWFGATGDYVGALGPTTP